MLKFLLIVALIGYVVVKGLGFFIKLILGSPSTNQFGSEPRHHHKPADGNVNVSYSPKDNASDKKKFKGGEYVDFEEID